MSVPMAILKWVEYKIICDVCFSDIIPYDGMESRKAVIAAYKHEFGVNPKPGKTICETCIENEVLLRPHSLTPNFKEATTVSIKDFFKA